MVEGSGAKPVAAIVRGVQVLDALAGHLRPCSLNEVAQATGLNKATVHRVLATLVHVGWVSHGDGGHYRLSPRVLSLARSAQAQVDVRGLARPELEWLADRFGDTAFLFVPTYAGGMCIDTCDGDSPIKVNTVSVGTVLPCHVSGAPVLMAAYVPRLREVTLDAHRERFTEHTEVDRDALIRRWDAVAEQGWIYAEHDLAENTAVVAAPVFGPEGLVATISLGGLAAHFSTDRRDDICTAVRGAADRVTEMLGGTPPSDERGARP